jgi:8-oxo-dGTP diphosphatase
MKTDLVVAGYIFYENKVLLIHHSKLDLWLPVGGHIEPNETPDEALLREIKEETQMDVEIVNNNCMELVGNVKKNLSLPFNVNVHSVGDHYHCCFFYVCKAKSNQIKINKELKNFAWFSRQDLNKNHVPVDVKNMALKGFEILKI